MSAMRLGDADQHEGDTDARCGGGDVIKISTTMKSASLQVYNSSQISSPPPLRFLGLQG